MSAIKKTAAGAVLAGAMFFTGGVAPANAVTQDGLVNVNIGEISILEDVNVNLAAQIVANICGSDLIDVVAIANDVDLTGESETVCTNRAGQREVTITDNEG